MSNRAAKLHLRDTNSIISLPTCNISAINRYITLKPMWSGEFDPSKKKISLGGKKKGSSDTKNDVLKKAADERLHRALVR
jgi:hypothetical protein